MIQEKDFLYRVPVKNALVTAPGKQVRNPEILVDLEGGEFMHGNILDANSTNKLIDQSVKDAIDNSIENGNYVTRDLLEAETSARTKSDEDLNAKIKAEQTRAEGKEKEISDKLAIVDGDSNTEGSFRKAIADVIAAAPEDLDTLKEIADKLAGNDDLHTALNQAITEKADASALANEVTRATGVENDLRTAIGTKADATALSNYVLTTALNQQIDTLNTAISAKQDAGDYALKSDIPEINTIDFVSKTDTNTQIIKSDLDLRQRLLVKRNHLFADYTSILYSGITIDGMSSYIYISASNDYTGENIKKAGIKVRDSCDRDMYTFLNQNHIVINKKTDNEAEQLFIGTNFIASRELDESRPGGFGDTLFLINEDGIQLRGGDDYHVLTSDASTIDITQYALRTEIPTVPTDISQLTNDSNFITQRYADAKYALVDSLYDVEDSVSSLRVGLSKKQDKITVNRIDVTDIETADITQLRTIVKDLIDALNTSGLIGLRY